VVTTRVAAGGDRRGFLAQPGAGRDGALGFVGGGGFEVVHAEGDLGVEHVAGCEDGPQFVGIDVEVEALDRFHQHRNRSLQGT
jgi:hypothetical protein